MEPKIQELAGLLKNARYVLAFTGASISTESGLPDFSTPDPHEEQLQAPA